MKQIIIIVGFVLMLAAIPLSLYLVKGTQIFNSEASNETSILPPLPLIIPSKAPSPKAVPGSSPLSELEKLKDKDSTKSSSLSPTPTPSASFGPTLSIKVILEGRPAEKQSAQLFVGIASGAVTQNPAYILNYTPTAADNGSITGLSLAGLTVGSSYTAYIKGPAQITSASTFTVSPTESLLNSGQAITLITGDLNEDNAINTIDYNLAKSIYAATPASANWNPRADFNLDNVINNMDISIITKNLGKTGLSGTWYSAPPPTPTATASAVLKQDSIGSPSSGLGPVTFGSL